MNPFELVNSVVNVNCRVVCAEPASTFRYICMFVLTYMPRDHISGHIWRFKFFFLFISSKRQIILVKASMEIRGKMAKK